MERTSLSKRRVEQELDSAQHVWVTWRLLGRNTLLFPVSHDAGARAYQERVEWVFLL